MLLPNTRRGKLLAAKLGYRLSAAVSNDASEVALQDGKAAVKHMVYGGLAIGARPSLRRCRDHAQQRNV